MDRTTETLASYACRLNYEDLVLSQTCFRW